MTTHIFAAAADNTIRAIVIDEEKSTIAFTFANGTKSESPVASSIKATVASFDNSGEWVRVQ